MNFYFGLYLFATSLVLVQCNHHLKTKQEDPHDFKPITNCHDLGIRSLLGSALQNSRPEPRMTLVSLIPQPNYEYRPKQVLVSRCTGDCDGRMIPTPTKIDYSEIYVRQYPAGETGVKKCGTVKVENHIKCKCMCDEAYNICNPKTHYWNTESCDCTCNEHFKKDKMICKMQPLMEWDATRCVCQCKQKIMNCMTGLHWDPEACRCMQN